MTDSFVFYKSFYNAIRLLPSDSEKWEVCNALFNLAFNGVEPDLEEYSDNVKIVYFIASEQVKASVQHKIDGQKGGLAKAKNRQVEKNDSTPISTPLEKNNSTPLEKGVDDFLSSNVNVNVNDNENVNENENANGVLALTPSQTKLSKTIFNIFKDAGLPCQKQNEISFLQTDFMNAMTYLHKTPEYKRIHSDDLIGAINNYIKILEDPDSYVTCKMDFFTLVKSKTFYSYLPANFEQMNFKKFTNGKEEPQKKPKREFYFSQPCPHCKALKLVWSNERQLYECRSCSKDVRMNEVEDPALKVLGVEL